MPTPPVQEYEFDILLDPDRPVLTSQMHVATQNDWELVGMALPVFHPAFNYVWVATMRRAIVPP